MTKAQALSNHCTWPRRSIAHRPQTEKASILCSKQPLVLICTGIMGNSRLFRSKIKVRICAYRSNLQFFAFTYFQKHLVFPSLTYGCFSLALFGARPASIDVKVWFACADALKTKSKIQKPKYKSVVSNTLHFATFSCSFVTMQQE